MTRLSSLRMPPLRLAGALAGLAALAACSAVKDPSAIIDGRIFGGTELEPISVTPGEALLQMTLPESGATATMKRTGQNGGVATWISNDRITVSLDEGVLVATRGLGHDLMGANSGQTLAAIRAGSASYGRRMRYLTSDNHSTWIAFGCEVSREGSLVTEACESLRGNITNSYWLDSAGRIDRSRQWVSPEEGYIEVSWARRAGG